MLLAARRGAAALADPRAVAAFVGSQAAPEGGFRDRSGKCDLYYTVFGLQCLAALRIADCGLRIERTRRTEPARPVSTRSPPRDSPSSMRDAESYLGRFADLCCLDLVHAACLARCWAVARPEGAPADLRRAFAQHIESFRAADGGYHAAAGAGAGSAYGAFLALGAYQDLGAAVPDPAALARSVRSLRTPDGGYTNERFLPLSSAPATAACIVVLRELGEPAAPEAAARLLAWAHPSGGFLAMAAAPAPDLLSTATALHALARAGVRPDEPLRAGCARFAAGLLGECGGFRGHADDPAADCEYTFYGLLALGHLAS